MNETNIPNERHNPIKRIMDIYAKTAGSRNWMVSNQNIVEYVNSSAEFGYLEGILQVLDVVSPEQGQAILEKLEQRVNDNKQQEK